MRRIDLSINICKVRYFRRACNTIGKLHDLHPCHSFSVQKKDPGSYIC
uniref:Uncharacterized protein n=1 Tax=Lepeophtheirus salmonis TaxID=72036 RepID=A0A0K2TII7_LEPSM